MSVDDLTLDRTIAGRLAYTWPAFFERFGRLRPVQRRTIPDILVGKDVLIASATASGKTEAALAPMIERLMRHGKQWTILYLCPTRALVNDLFERLRLPAHILEIQVARRTGDHKSTLAGNPNILVTTPESFDSLICRGKKKGGDHPLFHVDGVVLDEIHLLDHTARGEQLRWLLQRLRRVKTFGKDKGFARSDEFQVVGLSATLANPASVGKSFLRDAVIHEVPGSRTIEVIGGDASLESVERRLTRYILSSNVREKILVFCQTRKRVDALTLSLRHELTDTSYVVRAHHGSLAQKEREGAEQTIKNHDCCVLVATTTLEIGIDIGDIDLVVLDGPPLSVSSFLQRIGRGNRRTSTTKVMICGRSEGEAVIHLAMVDAGRAGRVGYHGGGPQYAVCVQQIASYIFQSPKGWRPRNSLVGLVKDCLPEIDAEVLIDHLIAKGEFDADERGLRLGESWRERTAGGRIHSNIERPLGLDVVDEKTGSSVALGIDYQGGSGLRLAGSQYEARRIKGGSLEVRKASDGSLPEGSWSYLSSRGAPSDGQPEAVRESLGIPADIWPVLTVDYQRYVFHLGGNRRQCVLDLIGRVHGYADPGVPCNNWYLTQPLINREKPEWLNQVDPKKLERQVKSRMSNLEAQLGRPYANKLLTEDLRVREILGWLDLTDELKRVQDARWDFGVGKARADVLSKLIQI